MKGLDKAGNLTPGPTARSAVNPIWLVTALFLLFGVLLLPEHPRDLVAESFLQLPLELPLVVLAMLFLRGKVARLFRLLIVTVAGTMLLLRLADLGSQLAFDRRFSPLVEMHLIGDGWNLASQAIGRTEAAAVTLVTFAAFILMCVVLYRGLAQISRLRGQTRHLVASVAAIALVGGALSLGLAALRGDSSARVQADLVGDTVERLAYMQRSIRDQTDFVSELAIDPLIGSKPTFAALQGRDVVLVFVESYGRSFIDAERFRGPARERLAAIDDTIRAAGLHARSAWLTSPIRGGRSWLAHASFASGLSIANQARFDRLIASPRVSLNRLFGDAGWRTAGLMPAIQEAWPEGAWYGFGDTRDLHKLGYAGEAFGWVTMPDQYTLTAFETQVRHTDSTPVMAEIALISSHAPWTPLPRVVPWDAVGDGSIFDGSHRFGGTAAEVWGDREQVREHYALSLDYSLDVIGGYLERHGKGALVIVLGDHQPASIVNGWDTTGDVPIHVISDDRNLLARLPDRFWSDSMLPSDSLPSQPMEAMREMFSRRFEATPVPRP